VLLFLPLVIIKLPSFNIKFPPYTIKRQKNTANYSSNILVDLCVIFFTQAVCQRFAALRSWGFGLP